MDSNSSKYSSNCENDTFERISPLGNGDHTNGQCRTPEKRKRRDINSRRESYIEWDELFMATAFLVAQRSKDPCSQVGACIVNKDKKIVGTGYNGFPFGCSDDKFPWRKESASKLETKYLYVCHAEMNAILNKNSADVKDCSIYVGLFPCNECAKLIIQSGISEVIYMSDKHAMKDETIAAKKMLDAAKVRYRQYIPKNQQIVIDFTEIDWNNMTQLPPTPMKNSKQVSDS
nr:PREDICTED: deoxycytidylate deaminase [Bemisia tabaci]